MTTQSDPTNSQWHACPDGELRGLVQRLQGRRRREHLRQISAGVAMLAVVVMIGVYAVPQLGLAEPDFGGIVCTDVRSVADEYVSGRLDGGTAARIDAHVEACHHCRQFLAELQEKQSPDTVLAPRRPEHPLLIASAQQ